MGKIMKGILTGVLIFFIVIVTFAFYVINERGTISGQVVEDIHDSVEKKVSDAVKEIESKGEELGELKDDVGNLLEELNKMEDLFEDEEVVLVEGDYNPECSSNIYNCGDFSDHYEAQELFEECGGLNNDVHGLDRDKDGIACETLDW
jgi:hypothetical protein